MTKLEKKWKEHWGKLVLIGSIIILLIYFLFSAIASFTDNKLVVVWVLVIIIVWVIILMRGLK